MDTMMDTLKQFISSLSDSLEELDDRLLTFLGKTDEEMLDEWTDDELKDLQKTITDILLNRMLSDSTDRDSA